MQWSTFVWLLLTSSTEHVTASAARWEIVRFLCWVAARSEEEEQPCCSQTHGSCTHIPCHPHHRLRLNDTHLQTNVSSSSLKNDIYLWVHYVRRPCVCNTHTAQRAKRPLQLLLPVWLQPGPGLHRPHFGFPGLTKRKAGSAACSLGKGAAGRTRAAGADCANLRVQDTKWRHRSTQGGSEPHQDALQLSQGWGLTPADPHPHGQPAPRSLRSTAAPQTHDTAQGIGVAFCVASKKNLFLKSLYPPCSRRKKPQTTKHQAWKWTW